MVFPPSNIIHSYSKIVSKMMEKIDNNMDEIEVLKNIRNTLLPKLMSGEIRVPLEEDEMEEKVAQA